jgi:hypothetical protein
MAASDKPPVHHWVDVDTDPLWPELWLFLRSLNFSHDSWQDRCTQWQTHVNAQACLGGASENQWNASRIRILLEHLNILDTKFNVLLTVNTLFLVAFNVLLNYILTQKLLTKLLATVAVSFGACWLITSFICLMGERRLVWGDLGLKDREQMTWEKLRLPEALKDAEQRHVEALIVAVAKRTNKFRVGMLLTYFNVAFLAGEFIATIWRVMHH